MNTSEHGRTIQVNRAPVLTLWATVVAERLGFDHDAAQTLGRAVPYLVVYGGVDSVDPRSVAILRVLHGAMLWPPA